VILDPHYQPELCVSSDDERWNLQDVFFDAKEELCVATDGHMLVAVPAAHAAGESRYLSVHELAAARRGEDPQTNQNRAFPDWSKVVPPFKPGDQDTITIGLNAKYLARIVEALGGEQVYLTFEVKDGKPTFSPIIVRRPARSRDGREIALLLPVRVGAEEFEAVPAPTLTALPGGKTE
jgi:hypothetical protein